MIFLCSNTSEEHLHHLQQVFERLRNAKLMLKPRKCFFLRKEVVYLGHAISHKGIYQTQLKARRLTTILYQQMSQNLVNFLDLPPRRFIPGFAKVAHPVYQLLKEGVKFEWDLSCQGSFNALKELLTTAPVLSYPQFGPDSHFILETDASSQGLGAVLAQKQEDGLVHPVAYASRTLTPQEKNYAITEMETLAVVWAAKLSPISTWTPMHSVHRSFSMFVFAQLTSSFDKIGKMGNVYSRA